MEHVLGNFVVPVVDWFSSAHMVVVGIRAPRAENILAVAGVVAMQEDTATRQNPRPLFRMLAELLAELQRRNSMPRSDLVVRFQAVEFEVAVDGPSMVWRRRWRGVAEWRTTETRRL